MILKIYYLLIKNISSKFSSISTSILYICNPLLFFNMNVMSIQMLLKRNFSFHDRTHLQITDAISKLKFSYRFDTLTDTRKVYPPNYQLHSTTSNDHRHKTRGNLCNSRVNLFLRLVRNVCDSFIPLCDYKAILTSVPCKKNEKRSLAEDNSQTLSVFEALRLCFDAPHPISSAAYAQT